MTALCACHQNDDPEDRISQRTVIVYMAAENNLSSYAYDDLEEMKEGSRKLSDLQNLIVYVDRANATTTPYLARVKDGALVDTLYMPEGVAADPSVLGAQECSKQGQAALPRQELRPRIVGPWHGLDYLR